MRPLTVSRAGIPRLMMLSVLIHPPRPRLIRRSPRRGGPQPRKAKVATAKYQSDPEVEPPEDSFLKMARIRSRTSGNKAIVPRKWSTILVGNHVAKFPGNPTNKFPKKTANRFLTRFPSKAASRFPRKPVARFPGRFKAELSTSAQGKLPASSKGEPNRGNRSVARFQRKAIVKFLKRLATRFPRKKGNLWKLRVTVYNLGEAGKECYETISGWVISIGTIKSETDPASFYYMENGRLVHMLAGLTR